MNLLPVEDSAIEPITIDEAKKHLRIFEDIEENEYLLGLIRSARQYIETYCGISIISRTWELYLDAFPSCIEIPEPRLIDVISITYSDTTGTEQTLAPTNYRVSGKRKYARIFESAGSTWPDTENFEDAVTVQFTAGFGATREDVPEAIKQAIKLLIGHWYENRGSQIIGVSAGSMAFAVDAILSPYRELSE